MTYPKNSNNFSMHESDHKTYKVEIDLWYKCIRGGKIVCSTSGKAINLRYRMYRVRKKMQGSAGETPFDGLIIRLEAENTTLSIKRREPDVIDVIPDEVSDEDWGIVPDPRDSAEAINARAEAAGLLKPRKPLINKE